MTHKAKVDFMIIGSQKCGTTSLFDILCQHPAMSGSSPKETDFFSTAKDWRSEIAGYHACFSDSDPKKIHFEASPTYTFFPTKNLSIWEDLYEYNPALKFIYIVRRPVDRILSAYVHTYVRGYTSLPIEDALIEVRHLVDSTRYYTQIMPYIRRFGRDQVLILDFEDFVKSRDDVMKSVSEFLGVNVDDFGDYHNIHSNRSSQEVRRHHRFDLRHSTSKFYTESAGRSGAA